MTRHMYQMATNMWAVLDDEKPEGSAQRITFHYTLEDAKRHQETGKVRK